MLVMDDDYHQQSAMILAVTIGIRLLTFCTPVLLEYAGLLAYVWAVFRLFFFTVLTTNLIVSVSVRYVHTQSEVIIMLDLDIQTPLSS